MGSRSATGPDDFVNGYLTPAGCFGDRARSSRAGKACDASTLLYGHAVRQRWCTSGTQNLLICLRRRYGLRQNKGLGEGNKGNKSLPFHQMIHLRGPSTVRVSTDNGCE